VEEERGPATPIDFREVEPAVARDPHGDDVFADITEQPAPAGPVVAVVGVRFRPAGKIYEYDAGELSLGRGERVMVDGERSGQVGTVAVAAIRSALSAANAQTLKRVLRRAAPADLAVDEKAAVREKEAAEICRQLIKQWRLQIKLSRVEMPTPGRLVVHLASEERIELQGFLRDLGAKVHARIDVRHMGPRDEAKQIGGIGDCGQELCCSTFLPRFEPISIKMAKDQGLVLNPTKLAGQCGRLKCCLVYEHATYVELRKGLPKVGKRVQTPAGGGKVADVDVLRRRIRVQLEDGTSQTFPSTEVTLVAPPQPGGNTPPAAPGAPPAAPETPPTEAAE
jgi:cell fate regulator YaaT (PSP1 superfamily)